MVPTVVPWGNKDMKADPDLKDMEARLSAFEKRSWVPRMPRMPAYHKAQWRSTLSFVWRNLWII